MPRGTHIQTLDEARSHASALLALLPEVKESLKEAGINGGSRRLVTALARDLIRLMEQVDMVEQEFPSEEFRNRHPKAGLAALYGIWQGVEISEEAIEAAKFRGTDAE